MKNILFVCKHNVFRSKIAEAYFKKINKNRKINVNGAGIIKSDVFNKEQKEIISFQRKTAKKLGINVQDGSNILSVSLLKKQDIIIIVANDVFKQIFNDRFYLKPSLKIIVWDIPDVKEMKNYKDIVKKDIKEIIKKVDALVKDLEKKK